ncbi:MULTISPECIES: PH domain-containing protein [Bacillus]|uniref:PH domain-containing protein n=1 Tax=Bacillus TaxID=1386 RepID=UPI00030F3735|nr:MULTISPECIES: PH domain-containing protein [Bacillus]MBY0595923.1 PH domain-containing protein [Bacillus bingmayongensis]MCI0768322.1 PH domain-containing protein [Bacillus sp. TL12]UNR73166.1 BacM1 [Bacillus sp. (in: firmicutes)]UXM19934.1 PH domain-containing protein [Bacillus thuringiensis]
MIKEPQQKISPNAVKVWRISDAITYTTALCVLGILLFLQHYYDWKSWISIICYIIIALLIISSIFELSIIPIYRQRTWRYEIDENYIQLKHGGALMRKHLIIPMTKVQYVNTNQGPILRKFGLSTLTIGTMASEHEIPAISEKKATELRANIAYLAGINEINE